MYARIDTEHICCVHIFIFLSFLSPARLGIFCVWLVGISCVTHTVCHQVDAQWFHLLCSMHFAAAASTMCVALRHFRRQDHQWCLHALIIVITHGSRCSFTLRVLLSIIASVILTFVVCLLQYLVGICSRSSDMHIAYDSHHSACSHLKCAVAILASGMLDVMMHAAARLLLWW